MYNFLAEIKLIGINPYVSLPEDILKNLFADAGKDKGSIPICGELNGKPYTQTLMKFSGEWRLYINTTMLKDSPRHIGETINMTVAYDMVERTIEPHPKLIKALAGNHAANEVFHKLSPSKRHEIIRYIAALKTETSVERNVERAISFLTGTGRFVGRDKP